jgi:cytochrome c556
MTRKILAAALGAALVLPLSAFAQDGFATQIKARQGEMDIMALNIGIIANMARGTAPYDAAAAQEAANNLAAVSSITQTATLWPEGSDNAAAQNTNALPAIWTNLDDFTAKWAAYGTAAQGLAAVAGNGQEALGAALGPVGGACGACHEAYRAPMN